MAKLKPEDRIKRIQAIWRGMSLIRKLGILLLGIALLITLVGYLNQHGYLYLGEAIGNVLGDFYANVTTELVSIAITVLIIDTLVQRRENQREKRDLILQMGSPDNAFAREAIRKLRTRGWLSDGSLHGADLAWADLRNTNLFKADLRRANLTRANLSEAVLCEANLREANLWTAILAKADLRGANLREASLQLADLCSAKLSKGNLSRANLEGTLLRGGTLNSTDLREANLYEAILERAFLFSADLREANLTGADLHHTVLRGADLRAAVLHGVSLFGADLRGADLRGADLREADLRGAKLRWATITNEQLAQAWSLDSATLPDGTTYAGKPSTLETVSNKEKAEVGETIPTLVTDPDLQNAREQLRKHIANTELKAAREQAGLSRAALAGIVGVSRTTVGRWERDGTMPRYTENRQRVAEVLGCWPWPGSDDLEEDNHA